MDDGSRIDTYKQFLRVKYRTGSTSPDITGLQALVDSLGTGSASNSVVITGHTFEGGQSTGQLVFEPLAALRAALDILAEVDPTNTPPESPNYAYVKFGAGLAYGASNTV